MRNIGTSLILQATGEELQSWPRVPVEIVYKGETRTGAIVGAEIGGDALLVRRVLDGDVPYGNPSVASETAVYDGAQVVVTRIYAAPDYAAIRAGLSGAVKSAAGEMIEARYPIYKQINLPRDDAEAGAAMWAWIDAVRAHSNTLEAEVAALPDSDLQAWQHHGWPQA